MSNRDTWQDLGLVFTPDMGPKWMGTHAQVPTPLHLPDQGIIRVYIASRPHPELSLTGYVDLDDADPTRVLDISENPLLQTGKPGTFDEHGIMPSAAVADGDEILLYYSGWSRATTVPYTNSTGLAISSDGGATFDRFSEGPILSKSIYDPYSATSPCVLKDGHKWHMWYCSGTGWLKRADKYEHVYDIKRAESTDGREWRATGEIALAQPSPERALTRPWVIPIEAGWRMYYCHRGSDAFRDGEDAYVLASAESKDLASWKPTKNSFPIPPQNSQWHSKMAAYPAALIIRGQLLVFYNGNGFGVQGFGLGRLKLS